MTGFVLQGHIESQHIIDAKLSKTNLILVNQRLRNNKTLVHHIPLIRALLVTTVAFSSLSPVIVEGHFDQTLCEGILVAFFG